MEVVTEFESETAVNVDVPLKVEVRITSADLSSAMDTSSTAAISFTEVTVSLKVVESFEVPSEA